MLISSYVRAPINFLSYNHLCKKKEVPNSICQKPPIIEIFILINQNLNNLVSLQIPRIDDIKNPQKLKTQNFTKIPKKIAIQLRKTHFCQYFL
jgi:hypothetical protein